MNERRLYPISGGEGNGTHVTRAELAIHIRRIDEHLTALSQGQEEIVKTLNVIAENATRWRRWWVERFKAVVGKAIDNVLAILVAAGIAATATYLLSSH